MLWAAPSALKLVILLPSLSVLNKEARIRIYSRHLRSFFSISSLPEKLLRVKVAWIELCEIRDMEFLMSRIALRFIRATSYTLYAILLRFALGANTFLNVKMQLEQRN